MPHENSKTWLCPCCSLERFPYGEPCPTWATSCLNMETPNINGAIFKRKLADWKPLDMNELAAVGIAAISDEDSGASSRLLKASKQDET